MKHLIDFIKFRLFFFSIVIKVFWGCRRKKTVILMGTPLHGNLGDQAIAYSEYVFFQKLGYRTVEIPSPYVSKYIKLWKLLIGSKRVYIHGGGFIGALWPKEHDMLLQILNAFLENEIIILPQTIDFGDDDSLIDEFNSALKKCKNVVICAREKFSYQKYYEKINFAKMFLIPDMVLFLEPLHLKVKKDSKKAVFCMRTDKEKMVSDNDIKDFIQNVCLLSPDMEIIKTDTVQNIFATPAKRKKLVEDKIEEFSKANLLITDRLHGMVFGYLAGVPVAVLSNINHKVSGIYDWIKENTKIRMMNSTKEFGDFCQEILSEEKEEYFYIDFKGKYQPLIEIVKNGV
ncbi:MAG: polysaccharide pyruvyl transferase family protein [Lachnospiraceae bacterium]|nr:polysaccharide pyruvyl transferase family protein [Lachnospiraceae bacterium]